MHKEVVQFINQQVARAVDPSKIWIGMDFDGTLVSYDRYRGPDHIGSPIKPMVEFTRELIRLGYEVRIFTARVSDSTAISQTKLIQRWCKEHLGEHLKVTCTKDKHMFMLFDDRCYHTIRNTGEILWPGGK